jgi:hypothetical protein
MEDIIYMFYCCIILHNMAVMERINSGAEGVESDLFYDCVANESGDDSAPIQTEPRSRLEQLALDLVDDEERNVRERASEVEFLAGLGINVLDMSLQADTA